MPRARLRFPAARSHRAALVSVAVVVAALIVTGCGGGSNHAVAASGCGTPVQEKLDPQSTRHLFPGAAEPTYLSDPPTSGPHRLGPPPTGAISTTIPRPVQVAMLESGYVILQYHGLPAAQVATLAGLAGDRVTVAPATSLPAPIVGTAWTWKLDCATVDPAALTAFVLAHRGRGFAHA
jgi:hypothetical protein